MENNKEWVLGFFRKYLESKEPEKLGLYDKLDDEEKIRFAEDNFNFDYDLFEKLNMVIHSIISKYEFTDPEIQQELTPLVLKWITISSQVHDAYRNLLSRIREKFDFIDYGEPILFLAPFYLILLEGSISDIMNIILFLKMKDGVKFEKERKARKVYFCNTWNQIRKLDLAKKIQYMKDIGLVEFVAFCNSDLRNSIAHMEFLPTPDGKMIWKKSPPIDDLGRCVQDLEVKAVTGRLSIMAYTRRWKIND